MTPPTRKRVTVTSTADVKGRWLAYRFPGHDIAQTVRVSRGGCHEMRAYPAGCNVQFDTEASRYAYGVGVVMRTADNRYEIEAFEFAERTKISLASDAEVAAWVATSTAELLPNGRTLWLIPYIPVLAFVGLVACLAAATLWTVTGHNPLVALVPVAAITATVIIGTPKARRSEEKYRATQQKEADVKVARWAEDAAAQAALNSAPIQLAKSDR